MRKVLLMTALAVMTAVSAGAQKKSGDVKPFEFEAGVGAATGNKSNGTKTTPGAVFYVEGRYNIPNSPFDVGLQGYLGNFDRENVALVDGHHLGRHIMPRIVTAYGDYNFRKWRRVSLFGGAGLGYARVLSKQSGGTGFGIGNTARENFLAVTPRVGAEFFHRVRLTVDCKIISKYYSCYGVNLGFVFGGGAKE